MNYKDCFFIVDSTSTEEKESQKIKAICIACQAKENIQNAWFWEGSQRGYAPYLFQCDKCKEIIYKPEE